MRLHFALFLAVCLTARLSLSQEVPADLPSRGPEFENPAEAYASDVIGKADQMMQARDYNGAALLLTENFERLSKLRAAFFTRLLSLQLAQEKDKEAREFYLRNARQDPELARAGFDQVYSYYLGKQDNQAVSEWTAQLADLALPEDLSALACGWHLNAACAPGLPSDARELVKKAIGKFNAATCRSVFAPAIASLAKNEKYDDAVRLLDLIDREGKGAGELRSMASAEKEKINILRNRWAEVESFLTKTAGAMTDDDLAGALAFAAAKARTKDAFETVDRMSMFILNGKKENGKARNEAALVTLRMLRLSGKIEEIPARFEQVAAAGLPALILFNLYCENFYPVILLENKEISKRMMLSGEKIGPKLENPDDRKQLALLLMDGAFMIADYERALQIIDANLKYWEKGWLDSTKAKIGAHLALQKKQSKEAVEGFRQYMDYVAKNNTSARNPVSGQIYTREMILGFNALRIGNIQGDDLKDPEAARKSYDEAEGYFKTALGSVKPNSQESKYIEENMAQIAARRKK